MGKMNHLFGTEGNDILTGSLTDDYLHGRAGDDTLYGGEGNDTLYSGEGNDVLYGGAGNDYLDGEAGDDILDGGEGNDKLHGGAGIDTYIFKKGYGNDIIRGYEDDNTELSEEQLRLEDIAFEEVQLEVSGNNLVIRVKETNDTVALENYFSGGKYAIGEIVFADGTTLGYEDVIKNRFIVEGTDQSEIMVLTHETGTVYAYGKEGNDTIYGTKLTDYLYGGKGNDTLYGYAGDDKLYGGAGNDLLEGAAGNDILDGGAGDDILSGGAGIDTYIFRKGYGNDIIRGYRHNNTQLNEEQLLLKDIKFEEVKLQVSGNDLVVRVKETNDTVTLEDYFSGGEYAIGEIVFADGKTLGYEDVLKNKLVIEGTDGNDIIYGTQGDDYIRGGLGDDHIYGNAGNDEIYGDGGNDILDGGIGDDYLEGRSGNDTYIYKKGYGNDRIGNYSSESTDVDELRLEDITFEEVQLEVVGNNLLIHIKETNETVTIEKYFEGEKCELEKITFADGTILTYHDVIEQEAIKPFIQEGTEGEDFIHVKDHSEVLYTYGKGGDDTIEGTVLDDYIYGGAGNDYLDGGKGNDYICGGTENDAIFGGSGDDKLYGDTGDDYLYGEAGNDKLYGGAGDDNLDGGVGNDTYFYEKGYGNDRINNSSSAIEDEDTLIMSGIKFEDTQLEQVGQDLVINVLDVKGSMTVDNYFTGGEYALEQIKFADGIEIENLLNTNMTVNGSINDNIIDMSGVQSNLIINANGGNDTLIGGQGNDTLYGGTGNDTYIFNLGAGQDTIYEDDATENNRDTVVFGDTVSNLVFTKQDNNLVVSNMNTEDQLTIRDWYLGESHQVEVFKTTDDYTLDYKQVDALVEAMSSFETEKGMSWNAFGESEKDEAKEVLNQFWVAPTI